jgi:hypothetical protein
LVIFKIFLIAVPIFFLCKFKTFGFVSEWVTEVIYTCCIMQAKGTPHKTEAAKFKAAAPVVVMAVRERKKRKRK